ncbi:MAG TPA: amidase [Rectinemataceae bacterium]|nr:amidase [Rectinemataceae bacterium]
MNIASSYSAFSAHRLIARGELRSVLEAALSQRPEEGWTGLLIFDNESGKQVDFDLRGSLGEVLARLQSEPETGKAGPGRPRLGVTSGEVTLLPRHWQWLEKCPRRASGTLRRLVDQAMKGPEEGEAARLRIEAASSFLWSMAGELENFEEVTRQLFSAHWRPMYRLAAAWPEDILEQLAWMLRGVPDADDGARLSWEGRRLEILPPPPRVVTAKGEAETWRRTATEIVEDIAMGRTSASLVLEAELARIEEFNPRVNSLTKIFVEEARAAARDIDALLEAGDPVGPLAGLPFTIKGNIDVAGYATDHGVEAMREMIAPLDSPLVGRLRRAGAIPLAHSNLPDLSLRFHTKSSLHGETLNPWDAKASPGGSSGGEGVALATGLSYLGLGNDAGGSLRVPSVLSGVAALKPGYGRFPSDRSVGPRDATLASQLVPVEGFLARSVADLHRVFQIAAGPDPRDPRVAAVPLFGPPIEGRVAVALLKAPAGAEPDRGVGKALEKAATILEAAGYAIEEVEAPRVEETLEAYGRMIMTEFELSKAMLDRILGEEGRRYISFATSLRKPVDLAAYLGLTALRQGLLRDWAAFFVRHPLAIGPVLSEVSFPAGFDIAGPAEHERVTRAMWLCQATSFVGLPSVSLPLGIEGGRPIGIQVLAGAYREDLCLGAAATIEAAAGIFTPIDPR